MGYENTTSLESNVSSLKFEAWVCCLFVILMLGIFGNLFAVSSILNAKTNKKYHFHSNWISSSMFFIHLLVVDLIYCLFLLAKGIHGFRIWKKLDTDTVNERECKFFVLVFKSTMQCRVPHRQSHRLSRRCECRCS